VANIEFEKKELVVQAGSINRKDFSNDDDFKPLLNVIELIKIG
jgi:hypothetical protein